MIVLYYGADAQRAIDECREMAMLRREIWQVVYYAECYHARPRSFDRNPEGVVGEAGLDGDFYVWPNWQETAREEGWR